VYRIMQSIMISFNNRHHIYNFFYSIPNSTLYSVISIIILILVWRKSYVEI